MANKLYFITGGARAGKSLFAEKLANRLKGKHAYIATAQALDPEMSARIQQHRERRGGAWNTFEEPLDAAGLVTRLSGQYQVILLDCLTLWLSNIMARSEEDEAITARCSELVESIKDFDGNRVLVSNEVGLGIVPDNPLARRFRDLAGVLNQQMAQAADEVYFMASGIPVRIK